MSSTLPSFIVASEPPPSPSEREALEDTIRRQAARLEKLQDGGAQQRGSIKPDEKQKLIDAISGLGERVRELERLVEKQSVQIETLQNSVLGIIERLNQQHENFNYDIAIDRQRIKKLEGSAGQQPKQKDRSDMLRLLLASHGGKMLSKDARHKLGISESQFSQLLKSVSGSIEIRPLHTDRRQHVILLKSSD